MNNALKIAVALLIALSFGLNIRSQTGGTFDLSHSVIANGGGSNSAGGQFQIDGTAGQGVAGTTSNASVYDLHGGFWFQNQPAAAPQIMGTVTYGNAIPAAVRFVSNVTITGAGSPTVMATTAAPGPNAGQYTLTGFGSGSYTVTPAKTGGGNSAISSFDAAKIAQHVIGSGSLTGNQLIVAEVSGNGVISSFDAAQVARYAIGLPPYGSAGTWRFSPVNRSYASVASSVMGEDYSALLMGEVSGNWNNTGARAVGSQTGNIAIEFPQVAAAGDKQIDIPVSVRGLQDKGVVAYQFDLRYDPSVLQPLERSVELNATASGKLTAVVNADEPGLLRVAVYGPEPIKQDGVLLNLRFTTIGVPGWISPLAFERILFNEGERLVTVTDGRVEVLTTGN